MGCSGMPRCRPAGPRRDNRSGFFWLWFLDQDHTRTNEGDKKCTTHGDVAGRNAGRFCNGSFADNGSGCWLDALYREQGGGSGCQVLGTVHTNGTLSHIDGLSSGEAGGGDL